MFGFLKITLNILRWALENLNGLMNIYLFIQVYFAYRDISA